MSQSDKPLELVVHSMPTLSRATAEGVSVRTRWKLLAIVLICSLPAIVACYAYFVLRPEGRPALGELVQPARTLPGVAARTPEGQSFALAALKGQWLLITVAGAACEADCQQRLYVQRQLREILGKERERVDTVWLINDQVALNDEARRVSKLAFVLRLDSGALSEWLPPAPSQAVTDFIFVVDPLGNAMMRFPARMNGAAANKAKRDLERLLRASASWDAPGR